MSQASGMRPFKPQSKCFEQSTGRKAVGGESKSDTLSHEVQLYRHKADESAFVGESGFKKATSENEPKPRAVIPPI
jgi:hypothetical protein